MKKVFIYCVAFALFLSPFASQAEEKEDDVIAAVREGIEKYQGNDQKGAIERLEHAVSLIRQKKLDALVALMPEPLEGWTSGETKSQSFAASLFGGGLAAERSYTKDEESVSVKFVADSPMLQGILMLFNNPTIMSASGAKLENIAGEKALVEYDEAEKKGKISVIVQNSIVVTVEGSQVDKEVLDQYARNVDYAKLADFK